MMGVADGRVWFQVDAEPGVWFFSIEVMEQYRNTGIYDPKSTGLSFSQGKKTKANDPFSDGKASDTAYYLV